METQERKEFIAALLQLQEYSENNLVKIAGVEYDIDDKLKELNYKPKVRLKIAIKAEHVIELAEGESLDDVKNRVADIYLHSYNPNNENVFLEKEDIGGDYEVKVVGKVI